jgi:hypothetical protein
MKRLVVTFVVVFVAAISGVAAASVFSGTPSPHSPASGHETTHDAGDSTEHEAEAVHGGPIDRFHEAGSCDLTAIGTLPGNWTHGDYVSAVAAGGTATQIQQAAESDCGKPLPAVGHGGPPAFAQQHATDGQAHANDRHILGTGHSPNNAGEPSGS